MTRARRPLTTGVIGALAALLVLSASVGDSASAAAPIKWGAETDTDDATGAIGGQGPGTHPDDQSFTLMRWPGNFRRCLRDAAVASERLDTASRIAAIHAAYRHWSAAPAPEIDSMLDEIELGSHADLG